MGKVEVFHDKSVVGNPLSPQFVTTLSAVAIRDYNNAFGLPDVKGLDLDLYEKSRPGANQETIDVAIGVADFDDCRRKASNHRLLLVELRMDYVGDAHNSHTSAMKAKETHSRQLLSGSPVDERCFFLFDENVAPKRLSIHSRYVKTNASIRNWRIVSPSDFLNFFSFEKDIPYKPQTNVNAVLNKVALLVKNKDIKGLFDVFDFWKGKEEVFYSQFNLNECDVIQVDILRNLLDLIKSLLSNEDGDASLELEIREEELAQIKARRESWLGVRSV